MDPITGSMASAGMGMVTGAINNTLQAGQNKKLLQQQVAAQKQMALFNRQQNMQMWKDTNYGAQVGEMKKAGLNVGLMYDGGGQGGTTGNASGSVSGASADSGAIDSGMGIMQNALLQQAQIELAKSQARKNNVEADKTAGVDTENTTKDTELKGKTIEEIATKMGVNVEQAKKLVQEVEESKQDVEESKQGVKESEARVEKTQAETNRIEVMTPIEKDLLKEQWKGQVTRNVYLNQKEKAELDNLLQDIVNKKAQIEQNGERLDIETFKNELQADYPSIWNVAGHAVDGVIRGIQRITAGKDDVLQRKVNVKDR